MKTIGRLPAILLTLSMAMGANLALAAVKATLDRDHIAMGDTVRLTITATDNEDLDDTDFNTLSKDFDILQRSSSSNTSIVNGHLSQSRQIFLDLAPRREGNLQIPPLRVGQASTPGIAVVVGPAPDLHTAGETVLFDAEVDRKNVYVQGQVILTLRVQQSINLENRSIEELKLDNAFVKPLEQHSFQRNVGGRQWLVHEVRYAIFPEKSGTLEIPAQVFSGQVPQPRRSLFDFGGGGKLLRRTTRPLTINVLPRPSGLNADTWLPVRKLTVDETWSEPPEHLRVGESATRTITIKGEGAQGAQLPPIQFTPIDGLKYYPDQPQISEEEIPDGLLGIRKDSAALVPTRAGNYVIPEIRIPWWDVETDQLRYAVIPERKITVLPAEPAQGQSAPAPNTGVSPGIAIVQPTPVPGGDSLPWQIAAALSTTGWLLTLVVLWWRSRARRARQAAEPDSGESERKAFRQLLSACAGGDPSSVRSALITWAVSLESGASPVSLEQVNDMFRDEALTRELDRLDASLYSQGGDEWNGQAVSDCLRRLRNARRVREKRESRPLELYPAEG